MYIIIIIFYKKNCEKNSVKSLTLAVAAATVCSTTTLEASTVKVPKGSSMAEVINILSGLLAFWTLTKDPGWVPPVWIIPKDSPDATEAKVELGLGLTSVVLTLVPVLEEVTVVTAFLDKTLLLLPVPVIIVIDGIWLGNTGVTFPLLTLLFTIKEKRKKN